MVQILQYYETFNMKCRERANPTLTCPKKLSAEDINSLDHPSVGGESLSRILLKWIPHYLQQIYVPGNQNKP